MKNFVSFILLLMILLLGAGTSYAAGPETPAALPDGVYSARFSTDSSMFRVNEALNGRGTLTVKDGTMTLHIKMV